MVTAFPGVGFHHGAGPQFTHIDATSRCAPFRFLLRMTARPLEGLRALSRKGQPHWGCRPSVDPHRFRKPRSRSAISVTDTNGSGVFAGSLSNIAQFDVRRPLGRVWEIFADLGYSKNERLQLPGSAVNASVFTYGYGGVGLASSIRTQPAGFCELSIQ